MITIDEKEMAIKIVDTLSFDNVVKYYIDEIKDTIKLAIENKGEDYFDEIEDMKSFLGYELNNEDKKNILEKIIDSFEYEKECRGASNINIFDKYIIMSAIYNWIDEKFNFDW